MWRSPQDLVSWTASSIRSSLGFSRPGLTRPFACLCSFSSLLSRIAEDVSCFVLLFSSGIQPAMTRL
eukprot:m.572705 g.572705  ORF g.572705 m.572705 type:complete len:67 (+) comp57868_c0_seq7:2324-2524(+)